MKKIYMLQGDGSLRVGVLAIQGSVREHIEKLKLMGVEAVLAKDKKYSAKFRCIDYTWGRKHCNRENDCGFWTQRCYFKAK